MTPAHLGFHGCTLLEPILWTRGTAALSQSQI
jgi:hypothetical protein